MTSEHDDLSHFSGMLPKKNEQAHFVHGVIFCLVI